MLFSGRKENLILRGKMSWIKDCIATDVDVEQMISLPRAIATFGGNLNRGTKSVSKDFFQKKYQDVFFKSPLNMIPVQPAIIDAMFLLYTSPGLTHVTFFDYFSFLFRHSILSFYSNQVKEVHVIFDSQDTIVTPKSFERQRRDGQPVADQTKSLAITSPLPKKWAIASKTGQINELLYTYCPVISVNLLQKF